jgi:3-methyladenine DNA glycosylase AlkD
MPRSIAHLKRLLRDQLQSIATPETKEWFENYTKNQERYLGVKTPSVEKIVIALASETSEAMARDLYLSLIKCPYTEDKLAGMTLYQKKLVRSSSKDWQQDLTSIRQTVEGGYISWWNTCDWLCVRVLGRIIAEHKEPAAKVIASWIDSENLWLKRMSLVSFVNHAKKGDLLFAGNRKLLFRNAKRLVRSSEHFHQTAEGWVFREVYKGDAVAATQFIIEHKKYFSREGLRYAVERMPEKERRLMLSREATDEC